MIDTISEGINIKDLILQQSKEQEKPSFDPRRDITEDDKKGILGLIGRKMEPDTNPDTTRHAAQMLAHLKLILPDTASTVSLSDENENKVINNIISNLGTNGDAGSYLNRAWPLHFLNQQKASEIQGVLGFDKPALVSDTTRSFLGHFQFMYFYKMSFPDEKISPQNHLLMKDVEAIQNREVASLKNDIRSELNLKNYIRSLARLRIVAPDLVDEIGINYDLVGKGNGVLDEMRKSKNYEEFSEYAFYLTILNAKDVNLSSKGLTYTMPTESVELNDKTNIPEVRRF
jgi:hypothetical protein